VTALFSLVPRWALALCIALTLGALGWQTARLLATQQEMLRAERENVALRQDVLTAQEEAAELQRRENKRLTEAINLVQQNADKQISQAAVATAVARTSADRLRERANILAGFADSSEACRAAAAASRETAGATADMRADMSRRLESALGRLTDAAITLATTAQARGIAGTACVSAYESLSLGN